MSKVKFLFSLVALAFVTFLIQAISGLILWLVVTRGDGDGGRGGGDGGSTFIWGRGVWLDIHKWTAVALLAIIAVHIFMHRKWLWQQIKSLFGAR
jgi:preprotein translocase subunit SecG